MDISIKKTGIGISVPNIIENRPRIICVCGKNKSGKSFLLRSIYYSLLQNVTDTKRIFSGNTETNIDSIVSLSSKISSLITNPQKDILFDKFWFNLEEYEKVPIRNMQSHLLKPEKKAANMLAVKLANPKNTDLINMSAHDLSDKSIFQKVKHYWEINLRDLDSSKVYRPKSNDPVLSLLKEFFDTGFGFHIHNGVGKFFIEDEKFKGNFIYFEDWNTGSKVFFNLLVKVALFQPKILIIDELENHLHPDLATRLLAVLKKMVDLVIIATHDIHIMSSSFVDQVLFISKSGPHILPKQFDQQDIISQTKKKRLKSNPQQQNFIAILPEKIDVCESSLSKFEAANYMFSGSDRGVLSLSETIQSEVSLDSINYLFKSNNCEALSSKNDVLPDSQTSILHEIILNHFNNYNEVNLFDIGAGKARQFEELQKYSKNSFFNYYCWDIEDSDLINALETSNYKSNFYVGMEFPPNQFLDSAGNTEIKTKFDAILLSNVIHRLWPDQFSTYLSSLAEALDENGIIIILEIDPLIGAERMAVDYAAHEISDIILDCNRYFRNVKTIRKNYGQKHRLEAVTFQKRIGTFEKSRNQILNSIEKMWLQKYERSIRMYESETKLYHNAETLDVNLRMALNICRIKEYFDVRKKHIDSY